MNKSLYSILFLIVFLSCKSNKGIIKINKKNDEIKVKEERVKCLLLKIETINLKQNVYELKALDSLNRSYRILSKLSNSKIKGIIVGGTYNFELEQLTHLNNGYKNLIINGKKVVISPNHYVQDCIKFNEQDFCSDSLELYRIKNFCDGNGADW